MNNSIIAIPIFALTLMVASCGNANKSDPGTSEPTAADLKDVPIVKPAIDSVDSSLARQIQSVFRHYLDLQSSLVADKPENASKSAGRINTLISEYADSALPPNQKQQYDARIAAIKASSLQIANTTDIETQRAAFEPLSNQVFELLKTFGTNEAVYQTHCSMALNNKGASWLSDKTAIRNPYFGDKMLECGEIVVTIKK